MSKKAKQPRRKENQAIAKARYVKGSERKLNLLAQLIRGKSAQRALIDLEFSHRRMSNDVYKNSKQRLYHPNKFMLLMWMFSHLAHWVL